MLNDDWRPTIVDMPARFGCLTLITAHCNRAQAGQTRRRIWFSGVNEGRGDGSHHYEDLVERIVIIQVPREEDAPVMDVLAIE